jgi:FAD/FMN-containing dehydrogenase
MRRTSAITSLRSAVRGQVYEPGGDEYDQARQTWNRRVEQRPALIVRAEGPADVRAAVSGAGGHGVPIAVQSTGHGTHVPADGALLIKTSDMAGVLIDPGRRTARVGPGVRWEQVIAAAAQVGLAPLSGSSPDVGVAGYTLGGGLGWLSRAYGFAADSLLRASLVTAGGRQVTVSRASHPDLFWALRGGGGNFGIVTSLEFRLYPVTRVYAGIAYFRFERAAETLARYREWSASEPDKLTTAVMLIGKPSEPGLDGPVLAIRALYAGPAAAARRALCPLWEAAGTPVRDGMREMAFAQVRGIPSVAPRNFQMAAELPDPLIEDLVAAARDEASVEIRHWGGAIAAAGQDAGPAGHRDVPFSVVMDGSPEVFASIRAYPADGSFLNFLHETDRTRTAYTPANYRRLRDVKGAWDPDNVFGATHNIAAAACRAEMTR